MNRKQFSMTNLSDHHLEGNVSPNRCFPDWAVLVTLQQGGCETQVTHDG